MRNASVWLSECATGVTRDLILRLLTEREMSERTVRGMTENLDFIAYGVVMVCAICSTFDVFAFSKRSGVAFDMLEGRITRVVKDLGVCLNLRPLFLAVLLRMKWLSESTSDLAAVVLDRCVVLYSASLGRHSGRGLVFPLLISVAYFACSDFGEDATRDSSAHSTRNSIANVCRELELDRFSTKRVYAWFERLSRRERLKLMTSRDA